MKDINVYIRESLNSISTINEGPGAGVSMDITAELEYNISINKGKVFLERYKLSDFELKVSSYDYSYKPNDSGRLINFKLFNKEAKYNKSKDELEISKIDITSYFKDALNLKLVDIADNEYYDDIVSILEEFDLTEDMSIKDISNKLEIIFDYADKIHFDDLSLNLGGYTIRKLDSKSDLVNIRSKTEIYTEDGLPYLKLDGELFGQLAVKTPLDKLLTQYIYPEHIYPTEDLINMYNDIHLVGFEPSEDSEDVYDWDIWWDDMTSNHNIG